MGPYVKPALVPKKDKAKLEERFMKCSAEQNAGIVKALGAIQDVQRADRERKQIRLQMAATLKAVVSQRLVRRADDKGRVPAVEVMIATAYIKDCIINADKTRLIHDAIAAGTSQYGMQTFDQSLFDLYTKELITLDEALARASNADEFKLRIQGIRSAADAAREEMASQMADFERFSRK